MRGTGRALLRAQRQAARLNEGLDDILGENRTKPSDGFSQDRTRQRATLGSNRKNRKKNKLTGTQKRGNFDLSFGSEKKSSEEEDDDRRFF